MHPGGVRNRNPPAELIPDWGEPENLRGELETKCQAQVASRPPPSKGGLKNEDQKTERQMQAGGAFSMLSILTAKASSRCSTTRYMAGTSLLMVVAAFAPSNQFCGSHYCLPSLRHCSTHLGVAQHQQDLLRKNCITSTKSLTAKKVRGLLKKRKLRVECGQTVAEGPRIVFDLLKNPTTASLVRQILVSSQDFDKLYRERLDSIIMSNITSAPPDIQLMTPEVLSFCSDTVTPQGIVAVVDIPKFETSPNTENGNGFHPLYLVLDGVSDPGNVGTLLRSALAVQISGVILLPECCDVWNSKAVRSAMGASFHLRIHEATSWEAGLDFLTNECKVERVYAATMMEEGDNTNGGRNPIQSTPHFGIDWLAQPSALVIGSEGQGLCADVRRALAADEHGGTHRNGDAGQILPVHVPMNPTMESLNAAICGSVILFEYSRQRQMLLKPQ